MKSGRDTIYGGKTKKAGLSLTLPQLKGHTKCFSRALSFPLGVERLSSRGVNSLIGVGPEVISLGLKEIGATKRCAIISEVVGTCTENWHGDCLLNTLRNKGP